MVAWEGHNQTLNCWNGCDETHSTEGRRFNVLGNMINGTCMTHPYMTHPSIHACIHAYMHTCMHLSALSGCDLLLVCLIGTALGP